MEETSRNARLFKLVWRALPVFSLGLGIASAFLMDRSPSAAKIIVPAALLGWGAMTGFVILSRLEPQRLDGRRGWVFKAARLGTLILMQSLMQQSYLFAIPFYVAASGATVAHWIFVGALVAGALSTLWDPLYEWLVARAAIRFVLESLGTFASANAILPSLGLGNTTSIFLAAAFASFGVPVQTWLASNEFQRGSRSVIAGVAALLVIPPIVAFGGARFVPPAPLSLKAAAIGTRYDAAELKLRNPRDVIVGRPDVLVCATAIEAPQGLRDELFHVWRRNGRVVDRIPLKVRGGREGGFRTHSKKSKLGKGTRYAGLWSCAVETQAGQVVGVARVKIKPGAAGADPRGVGSAPTAMEEASAAVDALLGLGDNGP